LTIDSAALKRTGEAMMLFLGPEPQQTNLYIITD